MGGRLCRRSAAAGTTRSTVLTHAKAQAKTDGAITWGRATGLHCHSLTARQAGAHACVGMWGDCVTVRPP